MSTGLDWNWFLKVFNTKIFTSLTGSFCRIGFEKENYLNGAMFLRFTKIFKWDCKSTKYQDKARIFSDLLNQYSKKFLFFLFLCSSKAQTDKYKHEKQWYRTCKFQAGTLRENCPYSEFFWSEFSHIRTEYGEILPFFPYWVQMRENTDQKNSEYRHFLRSSIFLLKAEENMKSVQS